MRLPGVIEAAHAVSENLLLAGFLWGGLDIPAALQEKKIWQLKRHWEVRSQWEMYRKLQRAMVNAGGTGKDANGRDARPHIVVTLREPVSRYLSEIYYQDFYEHDAVTVTPEIAQYLVLQRLHRWAITGGRWTNGWIWRCAAKSAWTFSPPLRRRAGLAH